MKTTLSLIMLSILAIGIRSMAQMPTVPSTDMQIKTAVMAAPVDKQAGAAVYGYSDKNELVLLRKGNNELICLADDPTQKGLSVSCYHRDLEPFMKRGRELKQQGKTANQIMDIRDREAKAKKLKMPAHPSSLFVYTAKEENYTLATGEVKDGYLRSVVYIAYATAESTGLPLKPAAPGMPWIMDPGTHRAHIMINPPVSTTAGR